MSLASSPPDASIHLLKDAQLLTADAGVDYYRVTAPELVQECFRVRHRVYVVEQGFLAENDVDELDSTCAQFLVFDTRKREFIGTGRCYEHRDKSGHFGIGRMALLSTERGRGVGKRLLETIEKWLLDSCQHTSDGVRIHITALVDKIGFWEASGYKEMRDKDRFEDEGFPHCWMEKRVSLEGSCAL